MNNELIKSKILEVSSIGSDPQGGISRVFGSCYIKECQDVILKYFKECGMETRIDSVGNVHGILKSTQPNAREVIIGSHYDTVKQGGIFDGLLGVIAGAEIVRELSRKRESLKKDIHVVATNGEEGNDLGGTFGSRAMMGLIDTSSKEYLEKAIKFGYSREDLEKAVMDTSKADSYLELHIEQGPTLDKNKEQIGIVSGIVGLRRYTVTVHGVSNHAGTTMMEYRDDALVCASKLVIMADQLAKEIKNNFVATIGVFKVSPNTPATIVNKVEMVLEIRNESEELMDYFINTFTILAKKQAEIDIKPIVTKSPIRCDEALIKNIESICLRDNLRYRIMPSGATHDGNAMATKMPVGMIFVPSKNGISHSREEFTEWRDVFTGISVLHKVIKIIAESED